MIEPVVRRKASQQIEGARGMPMPHRGDTAFGSAPAPAREVGGTPRPGEDPARAAEHLTLRILDRLFTFVAVLAPDGTLLDANEAPLTAAGIRMEDVRGKKFWDCYWWSFSEDAQRTVRAACERAARGETVRFDTVARAAQDSRMAIDFQVAPLRDDDGRITHLIPSAVDITERKRMELSLRQTEQRLRADIEERERTEEALRRSEARFKRLFETNLLGILFWDHSGGVHDANDELLRIVGHDRDDLRAGAINWARMTPPEHRAQDARAIEELRRTGKHAPIEKEYVRKDGSRVWVLVGSARIEGENGVGFVLDISRQKAIETRLRESERRSREAAARAEAERSILDAILEAAPAGIILADASGKLVRFNPGNDSLWGPAPLSASIDEYREWKGWWADRSERRGRRVEPHEWAMARALRGEPASDDIVEIEPFGQPGVRRTMLNRGAPVRDAEGRITGAVIVQVDISALVAAEEAARALNERLQEADRRKDEFIAILAHELRNPLAPVRAAVAIMRRLGSPDPPLARARDVIDRQITHMVRLIDDLLDVSRIARGKLALRKEICDLAAIARQTAEDYRASLEDAGLTLVTVTPGAPVWVEGDPVRLAQMIGNLLHNTIRFTQRGGRVQVRVEREAARRLAAVHVQDTGEGIDPALLPRLFDPFSQADQDLARSKGGLGLGLALTRGLAGLHGGEVTAHSEGPGHGALFTIRIPSGEPPPGASSRDGAGTGTGGGLRVLIIEDNQDAAETLGELLELSGHQVKLALDGAAGVAAAREAFPHVVISDLGLPGELDGYAVARVLRAEPALQGVYLIALSGYASEDARRRSREAGFDMHLAKPPDIARLERILADLGRR